MTRFARTPGVIEPHLGRHADFQSNAFTALNTAFFEDGVLVRIPKGAILGEPINLVFLSDPNGQPVALSSASPGHRGAEQPGGDHRDLCWRDLPQSAPSPRPSPGGRGSLLHEFRHGNRLRRRRGRRALQGPAGEPLRVPRPDDPGRAGPGEQLRLAQRLPGSGARAHRHPVSSSRPRGASAR